MCIAHHEHMTEPDIPTLVVCTFALFEGMLPFRAHTWSCHRSSGYVPERCDSGSLAKAPTSASRTLFSECHAIRLHGAIAIMRVSRVIGLASRLSQQVDLHERKLTYARRSTTSRQFANARPTPLQSLMGFAIQKSP